MQRDRAAEPRRSGAAAARRTLATVALVAALSCAAAARATCPGDPPALAGVPAEPRIAFLRDRLEAARPAAEQWTAAWALVDGAFTLGQVAAIPFVSDTGGRLVLLGGAASSALGLLQMAFASVIPPPLAPPDPLDPCATLADLESTLERVAANQRLGSGAAAHAGNVAINLLLAVGAAIAAGGWEEAAIFFGVGIAIGEAQILTMPTSLVRDRERYLAGDLRAGETPGPRVRTVRGPGLVSVTLRF